MDPVPRALVELVKAGQVVLVLCSGSAKETTRASGAPAPTPVTLAAAISKQFLGGEFEDRPLAEVCELAVSEADLLKVQHFVADLYDDLEPTRPHLLVPQFWWTAIATTNIDLLVERAYSDPRRSLQQCVPFVHNKESVDEGLAQANSVPYLKLHGCVTRVTDASVPLILSPDQHPTHRRARSLLFERLEALAVDHPFVFICDALSEPDLRMLLQQIISIGDTRPRSYIVARTFSDTEHRLWDARKFTPIKMSFADFMRNLDNAIPAATRPLVALIVKDEHPIRRRFAVPDNHPVTDRLVTFLDQDVDFLHTGYKSGDCRPQDFYRGYVSDWSPIEQKLDVPRALAQTLLSEIVLREEDELETQRFYLIKGHAGSGKTVILRRLAWDAAIEFGKHCLYLNPAGSLDYAPIAELVNLCKERIFLFVDQVTDHIDSIYRIIAFARKDKLPITIVGATRHPRWNALGSRLVPSITTDYEVRYLSEREVDGLIDLLQRHHSLGYLADLDRQAQRDALAKKAGRQLLVALHEATLGKPFSDIVFDEYNSITSPHARSLYLTVCVLHRLGICTRAGLISRVHSIPFAVFKQNLFEPLEYVVFARQNSKIRDYVYESRHPHIAELVFERVLTEPAERFKEYVRILMHLDLGYHADQEAFSRLTNARELLRLFPDSEMIRRIYDVASARYPEEPALLQQRAILEMKCDDGRLDVATELLRNALDVDPRNRSLMHSLSELQLRRADGARHELEREKYRNEARRILRKMVASGDGASYTQHSLIKIEIDTFDDMLGDASEEAIQGKIREIESMLSAALQASPDHHYVLDAESRFARLLDNQPRALTALKKAFESNKANAFVALRLAKMYSGQKKATEAATVLRECLELNPNDKDLHFELARRLMDGADGRKPEILYHLQQSFTRGDARFDAQFWFARELYLNAEFNEAGAIFRELRDAPIHGQSRARRRGIVREEGRASIFSGTIENIEGSYLHLKRDRFRDRIFAAKDGDHHVDWHALRSGVRVTFELAFSFRGPVALGLKLENSSTSVRSKTPIPTPAEQSIGLESNKKHETPVEVGIVIALKEEMREFFERIGSAYQTIEDTELGHHYYRFQYPPDNEDAYTCIATLVGEKGLEKMVLAAERFMTRWHPRTMGVIGIAAGLHPDLVIGDIVVATQVHLYMEAAKARPGLQGEPYVLQPGGSAYRAPRKIANTVKNIEFALPALFESWQDRCRQQAMLVDEDVRKQLLDKQLLRDVPRLDDGTIASGPVVSGTAAFAEWIRANDGNAKALDMESGAMMAAALERSAPPDTIVIRGVSDFGDERKQSLDAMGSGSLRRYAMRNALELFLGMLEHFLLERLDGSLSSRDGESQQQPSK